jgi:hypothetical protein
MSSGHSGQRSRGNPPSDQEFVFCHPSGAPVGSFKGGFQRALREAGVLQWQEAGPLLAPAHLRHHEARRGGQRLPVGGQHGDLGRDAGGLLRQEADAGPEVGDRGDEVQGTVIRRWQQNQ